MLWVRTSDGHFRQVVLKPMTVAEFYGDVLHALSALGIAVAINGKPNEIPDAIPFAEDRVHASYDRDYANRFWRVLSASNEVFAQFRTGFLGKASPVHFFWGSFDLAVTRFSGRSAPRHPGGVPNLPDDVAQEAYSHEVSSAGFWPGGGAIDYPAYYSYAYPAPEGFAEAPVRPGAGVLLEGAWRVHSALRRGAHGRRSARGFDGLPAINLRRGRRPRQMGPQAALECAIGEARVVRRFS